MLLLWWYRPWVGNNGKRKALLTLRKQARPVKPSIFICCRCRRKKLYFLFLCRQLRFGFTFHFCWPIRDCILLKTFSFIGWDGTKGVYSQKGAKSGSKAFFRLNFFGLGSLASSARLDWTNMDSLRSYEVIVRYDYLVVDSCHLFSFVRTALLSKKPIRLVQLNMRVALSNNFLQKAL